MMVCMQTNSDGSWAWKPLLFDNPVEKVAVMLKYMKDNGIVPECECVHLLCLAARICGKVTLALAFVGAVVGPRSLVRAVLVGDFNYARLHCTALAGCR